MTLTNGTFETGDLTGWTDAGETTGDSCSQATTVTTGAKRSGTYGLQQAVTANDSSDFPWAIITQEIDADFSRLSFWYKVSHTNVAEGTSITVKLTVLDEAEDPADYILLDEISVSEGDWTYVSVETADIISEGYHFDTTTTLTISSGVRIYD
jgi:hypothetical protein